MNNLENKSVTELKKLLRIMVKQKKPLADRKRVADMINKMTQLRIE